MAPLPTPAYFPEDYAAMRQALFTWADGEMVRGGFPTGRVVFGDQRIAHPAKPYVVIDLLTPPAPVGQAEKRVADGLAVRVVNVLDANTYTVTINGTPAPFLSGVNATDVEIRDGLIAAINAGPEPVTAAPISAAPFASSTLIIRADVKGVLFTIAVDVNLACKIANGTYGNRRAVYTVDAIADEVSPDDPDPAANADAAIRIAGALHASLESDRVLELFGGAGWGLELVTALRRPSVFAGAQFEDRSGFDLQLSCRSRDVDLIDWIDSATVGTSIVGSLSA